MSNSPVAAFSPRKLGRYTLLKDCGSGGMARVYLALRDGAEDISVIKLLKKEAWNKPNVARRFQREAYLASRLDHPNVARVFDAGLQDETFCMVSEFVAGKSIAELRSELYHRQEPFPYRFILHIIKQSLSGLAHIHSAKDTDGSALRLVHRDLSPRNIMLSYDGEVKIIDFGLAAADIGDFQTAHGTLLGTFPYISPEHARGRPVDGRSDLYSLCVILYESITGLAYIERKSPGDMLKQIVQGPLPAPNAFQPNVPGGLRTVIIKGLAKNPDERWSSAQEFRDALELAGGPLGECAPAELGQFLRRLFEAHAEEMSSVINFYEEGGEGARTTLASSTSDSFEAPTAGYKDLNQITLPDGQARSKAGVTGMTGMMSESISFSTGDFTPMPSPVYVPSSEGALPPLALPSLQPTKPPAPSNPLMPQGQEPLAAQTLKLPTSQAKALVESAQTPQSGSSYLLVLGGMLLLSAGWILGYALSASWLN